jgi:hypothetical protein
MPSIGDVRKTKLTALGFATERDWLIGTLGGVPPFTTMSLPSLWHRYFDSLAVPVGQLKDRWRSRTTALGYTGAFGNRLELFWTNL